MNQRPKWMGPLEPAVDAAAIIATAPAGTGAANVEVMKNGDPVPATPVALDLCMQKLGNLSHERQAGVRKLASQWLVLKRYGLAALTVEELEEVIKRLP